MQDTSSIGGSIIACAVVCWVLSGVIVSVRFYTRGKLSLILGREDWCVLVAWVSYIPSTNGRCYVASSSSYVFEEELWAHMMLW